MLRSTRVVPARAPESTPCGPRYASRTAAGWGRLDITTSADCPASAAIAAPVTPASDATSTRSALMS